MATAPADIVTSDAIQAGGFLDGGLADNTPGHQNYFVGYGTVAGFRSPQRRSFFWYHVPMFPGVVLDVSIKLKMLATTSLIFGYNPAEASHHDPTESFQLGATFTDAGTMTRLDLTSSEAQAIFDTMDDHPIAPSYDFSMSTMYSFPMIVDVHLDDFGKSLISTHRGMDIVLTGWMPTWTENLELDGSGHYIEGDELLFGLSDVPGLVPAPPMSIVFSPVPEPASLLVVGLGALATLRRRRSHT